MPWLIYVLIAIVLMGLSSFIVKKIVEKINPLLILFYQYLIAIPLVALYSFLTGAGIIGGSYLMVLLGILYVISITFFYIALSKGPLSKVSPVFNLKMIVTVVLGLIILLEPLSINLIVGLVFGVVSIYLFGGEKK